MANSPSIRILNKTSEINDARHLGHMSEDTIDSQAVGSHWFSCQLEATSPLLDLTLGEKNQTPSLAREARGEYLVLEF